METTKGSSCGTMSMESRSWTRSSRSTLSFPKKRQGFGQKSDESCAARSEGIRKPLEVKGLGMPNTGLFVAPVMADRRINIAILGGSDMKKRQSGFTLIELLIVIAIIGILAASAIPNMLNAVQRGKQKRTMSDMRALATAIEAYAVDNNSYPAAACSSGIFTSGTENQLATNS